MIKRLSIKVAQTVTLPGISLPSVISSHEAFVGVLDVQTNVYRGSSATTEEEIIKKIITL